MMAEQAFDPTNPAHWLTRGRTPEHAARLAAVWCAFSDLLPSATLEARMVRSRDRAAALRPINDVLAADLEHRRQRTNFGLIERRAVEGCADDRDVAILRGREVYGYDWDVAIRYADGWYAAHAGWAYRPFVMGSGKSRGSQLDAYDQGFRDGGGDVHDLFDTARRANLAAERRSNQPPETPAPASARPLPSAWQKPTDAPRPTRWERRLIVIAASEVPTGDRSMRRNAYFPSQPFALLRTHEGAQRATIVILSPENGFTLADSLEDPNSEPMTADRAAELARDASNRDRLSQLVAHLDLDDILIVAEGPALDVIDAHASALPLCRNLERARDTPLLQTSHLKTWLDRGIDPGTVRASGHIRWGKAIHGLTGRLGEFTARHTGPAPEGGHLIVVESADRREATGYATHAGEPLAARIVISNRRNVRATIAKALRAFAAAMPVTPTDI
jgi:hypothetical protein